jgi:uncharacterized membrane protein HdeD (DUF308 family)
MAGRSRESIIQEPLWSLGVAISLIILGAAALVLPYPFGLGVATVASWVLVLAGVVHLAMHWRSSRVGTAAGRLLIGLAYLAAGIYVLANPDLSQDLLMQLFAAIFAIEGVALLAAYFRNRNRHGAAWVFADGVVTLLIAVLIWTGWPHGSLWFFGILVGLNVLISGIGILIVVARRPVSGDVLGAKRL